MDKLGIKASIYDILGYIIPGLIAIIFMYMLFFEKDINWLISLKKVEYTLPFYILIFVIAYISGHIISSLSSFIFEGKITRRIIKKFSKKDFSEHNLRIIELFGKDYKDCEPQNLISFCQEKHPQLYDTAFVFLTIYGLSRNISASFIIVEIYMIKEYGLFTMQSWVIVLSIILLIRNYYRFKEYFNKKINSALYV
jgi:hypothetical protein